YYEGGAQPLDFTGGVGTSIDGTGVINLKSTSSFNINGNTTIASTANLYVLGDVTLDNDVTVTNNGSVETTTDIDGSNAGSTWTNASDSYIKVNGTIMATNGLLTATASGNTVEYSMDGAVNVITPASSTYYNLTISGTGTKTQQAALIISGDFTISSGTYDPNGQNIQIKGSWILSNDSYTQGTETVTFNGTGSQSITNPVNESFYNLTVDKSSGTLTLNDNVSVSNTLNFNDGIIDTDVNTLTLGNSGTEGTLTHANDAPIIGEFERWIQETSILTTYLFPTGTADDYRPINIYFDNLSAVGADAYGSVIAKFVESPPGSLNPRPTADNSTSTNVYNTFSDGYWTLTAANTLTSTQYDLELTGTGFIAFNIDADTRLFTRANSGVDWDDNGSHVVASGVTAKRADIITLSAEYCFADITNCTAPSTSTITGPDSVCMNAIDSIYSVTGTDGSTYVWEIMPASAGTITNQVEVGTESTIKITWSATGQDATISVTESNTCTTGDPQTLSITSHPVAPSSISGLTSVPENEADVVYSVVDLGYTYTWTITGGTLDTGQGTASITVDWGSSGTGNASVVASSDCGSAAAYDVDVNKYIVVESAQTGDWDQTTTWDCSCVPVNTDNIRILAGHTVTITTNNEVINNVNVNSGGTLDAAAKGLEVSGDFIINGDYTSTVDLELNGSSSVIGGTGTITADVKNGGGNKTILSNAILIVDGDFDNTISSISIINYGSMEITGDLIGLDGTVSWTNSTNSHLHVAGAMLSSGILDATASGNIVEYNGAGAQTIKSPNSNQYYNLQLTGSGTKSLSSSIDIDGDITINGSAVLDVTAASNFSLTVDGNWSDSSTTADAFLEQNGTVTFNGTTTQTITRTLGATTETFYNFVVNKASDTLSIANNVDVSNTLTMTQGLIDAGSSIFTLGTS
ncbi:beta strand repeat-containing protein, partial [Bacteroidota bacterium]